jgi:hypothetical protein
MFPFRETPGPGSSPHIVLVGSMVTVGSTRAAIVYYTTTRTEFAGTRRPRHLIHVDEVRTRDLGQAKAFDIDVARLALLPVTAAYFPELTVGAVPTHGSDVTVVDVVERRLIELRASGTAIEPVRCVPAPSRSPGR